MVRFAVLLSAAVLLPAGCTDPPIEHATVTVSPPSAPVDTPIAVRVSGLPAGQHITIAMDAVQYDGHRWSSHASYAADRTGSVDLAQAAPLSGTYTGADPMGLVWSMSSDGGDPELGIFQPPWPEAQRSYPVHVTVSAGGRQIGAADLARTWLGDAITPRAYADTVVGELYTPPADKRQLTGVLVFGGSEGGNGQKYTAALLASRGYPALAVSYFAAEGQPAELRDIPIEYFAGAIDRLRRDAHVDRVVVMAYSRGTEAAVLTASAYPAKVAGLVLYSPSDQIYLSPAGGSAAWTLHGRELSVGPLPASAVHVPVLMVAGGKDQLWPSVAMTQNLARHLPTALPPLVYPDAGHLVGTFPYLPSGTEYLRNTTAIATGGTRETDERAREDSWPQVLQFLASTS
jgi:dienelactone hydrolase